MITITDGNMVAEITVKLNGADYTREFLKSKGIIPNQYDNAPVPNIGDIVDDMETWGCEDPKHRECEVTFVGDFPGFDDDADFDDSKEA